MCMLVRANDWHQVSLRRSVETKAAETEDALGKCVEQLQEANRVSSRWRSKCISQEEQSAAKVSALEGAVKALQDAAAASAEAKKREVAQLRQQLEASFNSQQQALHSKLSDGQHALRQLESECSASKAKIKELEASSAKLRVRKATEEERLNEDIRKLRLHVKSLQEQLAQANSKSESLLNSGDVQLRRHHDEMSSLAAENAALREQLQKMMNMRTVLPVQSGAQMPPPAPSHAQPAPLLHSQSNSNQAMPFAQATPSYPRRDNASISFASDAQRSPWSHSSSAPAHAPPAVQPQPIFTPSAAASAVATPLWSHGGSRAADGMGMSFASQMGATGGGGRQDESSELLKQQYARAACLMPARTRSTDTRLRYTALVQEANRIKQEYKSMRAQVSGSCASALCGCMCSRCAFCVSSRSACLNSRFFSSSRSTGSRCSAQALFDKTARACPRTRPAGFRSR
jgi:hypothetical protein